MTQLVIAVLAIGFLVAVGVLVNRSRRCRHESQVQISADMWLCEDCETVIDRRPQ